MSADFKHIDWCSSTGEYGALDCDCPETPREELLLRKFDEVVLELESLKKNDPPHSREKIGVLGPDGHGGAYAVADHILRLLWKPMKVQEEKWEPSPVGRLSRGLRECKRSSRESETCSVHNAYFDSDDSVECRWLSRIGKSVHEWKHTGRLKVKMPPHHVPEPYARVGDDNRCMHCGDIIERRSTGPKEGQQEIAQGPTPPSDPREAPSDRLQGP